ncbi:MAG TPA: hypothetical protein VMB80_11245 [Candidatus Acidoferrum sp.]|nr:hypothetical protein [Candidatus Acidoferrum sp.]
MNKFSWIFGAILLLGIFGVVFWLRPTHQGGNPSLPKQQPVASPVLPQATPTVSQVSRVSSVVSNPVSDVKAPAVTNQDASQSRVETVQQALSEKNVPINFYGQVIDQGGIPVSGVKVNIYIRHWELTQDAMSNPVRLEKETDSDGRFEIHDAMGDAIDLEMLQKQGYQLSPSAQRSYGPSSGALEKPVIIKMWKQGPKERLIGGDKVFGIVPDGRIYTVDLLAGKKLEGEMIGDLRVAIARPNGVKPRDKYDWSWKIEGVQGGIEETDDEFMYLAPESGYAPEARMELAATDSAWTPLVKKRFFIRSRNGQVYGQMQVEINSIYNDHSVIEIRYAVNPNGSRNLQP